MYLEFWKVILQKQGPKIDVFKGNILRNLPMKLSDNSVFENSVSDFTPYFVNKG